LLAYIVPEVVFDDHLKTCLSYIPAGAGPDFALAALLHEMPVASAGRVLEGLRLSKSQTRHALTLVENRPRFRSIRTASISSLKRFLRMPRFDDFMELERMCASASGRSLEDYEFVLEKRRTWADNEISPEALISGDDLMAMGFTPGPRFKQILTRVEDEQLEGRLTCHDDAVRFVAAHFGESSPIRPA
jgi:poly(A) polymerase